ncbi:MAG: phosphatase PAP2 family protein [Paracoccaceae bacterium]
MTSLALSLRAGLIGALIRNCGLLALLVGLHALVALAAASGLAQVPANTVMATLSDVLAKWVPLFVVLLMVLHLMRDIAGGKPGASARLVETCRTIATDRVRIATGVLSLLLIIQSTASFAFIKGLIPALAPLNWDPVLADLDQALHFGRAPWQWLAPLLASPRLLLALNHAYHLWLLITFFVLFVAAFAPTGFRKARVFLVAFVLTWGLGGNGLAIAFASGGPVYYEALGHGTRFAPLMAALHDASQTVPLPALDVQAMLWQGYLGQGSVVGISAMPSMHVGNAVLMAIFGFAYARWAGWALVFFALLIQIGSVALGWHYAIDGYAGAALALLFWALADRLVPGRETGPERDGPKRA